MNILQHALETIHAVSYDAQRAMLLEQIFKLKRVTKPVPDTLQVGSRSVPLLMVHHPRARRYLLRLQPDGTVRVTIPRRGTLAAAHDFVSRNLGWLEQQFQRLAARPQSPSTWTVGTEILFRGEPVRIEMEIDGTIRFGTERLKISDVAGDLRPAIQKHLHELAAQEQPPRVLELATHSLSPSPSLPLPLARAPRR